MAIAALTFHCNGYEHATYAFEEGEEGHLNDDPFTHPVLDLKC